jgi:hypothetical protein
MTAVPNSRYFSLPSLLKSKVMSRKNSFVICYTVWKAGSWSDELLLGRFERKIFMEDN